MRSDTRRDEALNPSLDLAKNPKKGRTPSSFGSHTRCRIFKTPMCDLGLARPNRAGFFLGPVAQSQDQVEGQCTGLGKFIPTFAAKPGRVAAPALQEFQRQRVHRALGRTAAAIRFESTRAVSIEQTLRH